VRALGSITKARLPKSDAALNGNYFKNCQTMEEDGIKPINLTYEKCTKDCYDEFGNYLKYWGTAQMIDPQRPPVKIVDWYPVFRK
jgi:hypothetical protein